MFLIEQARREIIQQFSPHWMLNDEAHRQEHFEEVFRTGIHINNALGYGFDERHILFAAYFHDLFAWSRINHHTLSAEFIRSTDHPLIVKYLPLSSERTGVSFGCAEHRASYKGGFYSVFSELINCADRGRPDDVKGMVDRAIKYREWHHPDRSEDQRIEESVQHIKEKFGHGGYARYPEMYTRVFGEELTKLKDQIAQL